MSVLDTLILAECRESQGGNQDEQYCSTDELHDGLRSGVFHESTL